MILRSVSCQLIVNGSTVTGSVTVTGSPVAIDGAVDGRLDCNTVTLGRVDNSVTFSGAVEPGNVCGDTPCSGAKVTGRYAVGTSDEGNFTIRHVATGPDLGFDFVTS